MFYNASRSLDEAFSKVISDLADADGEIVHLVVGIAGVGDEQIKQILFAFFLKYS